MGGGRRKGIIGRGQQYPPSSVCAPCQAALTRSTPCLPCGKDTFIFAFRSLQLEEAETGEDEGREINQEANARFFAERY